MGSVICLPGWGTPTTRLHPLLECLEAAGLEVQLWSYEVNGGLDTLADQLTRRVSRTPRTPVHLVGHSLGGLVAARAALQYGNGRIASVTTINAPWRGTWVGYTGSHPVAVELRWGSDTLRQLRNDFAEHVEADAGPRWLLLSCIGDFATPATTALTAGADGDRVRRRVLPAWGHSLSLRSQQVQRTVARHVAGELTRS